MIKILIADDHPLMLLGIRRIISLDNDIDLVGEANNGWEVIERLTQLKCDIVLLDIRMPGPSGIEFIRRLTCDYQGLYVLVFSVYDDPETVQSAFQAGAMGYVTKCSEPETLLTAIRKVHQGKRYIDPEMAEKIIFDSNVREEEPYEKFSEREQQVFELVASGKANKEIAWTLNLSVKTVSTYKTRIRRKLAVSSNMEILRYAIQRKIALK